jgi:hypothetical protein
MRLEDFERFRGVAAARGVLFYHAGEFTSEAVEALAQTLRRRLDELGVDAPLRRRLHAAFVEMAQNVLHYAAEVEAPDDDEVCSPSSGGAAIAMGRDGDGFWVVCGNHLPTILAPRLAAKLEALRGLSGDELREAYRRQLVDEDHESRDDVSRGGGLGLMTVARSASAPLEWELLPHAASGGHLTTFRMCARLEAGARARRSA